MKLAIITWNDAFATDGTFEKAEELEHEPENYTIKSVGWLVRETDIIVTIAQDFEGTGQGSYRDIKRIRKENIKDFKIIAGIIE